MKLGKIISAVVALTATAATVKVVSDIIKAEKEDAIIDLDQLAAQKNEQHAEAVMAEVNKEEE